jgi:signal transduction histidine kinase
MKPNTGSRLARGLFLLFLVISISGMTLVLTSSLPGAVGGLPTVKRGAGLQNMADRIEALGGTLRVASSPGEGTVVRGTAPVSGGQAES